ncbi:MAG: alpha/beta fold hydrolase [Anaerolineales bacterium]|jgi:pimeloyl-ACP methyl ester carboxylesterase
MPYSSNLYYQAYQAGDPSRRALALIHGAGGHRLSWPSGLRRLSGWRVYAPDLPGHGKSGGPGLQRIADYGETLAGWIHSLDLPKVFLVGHSMGGAIALWLAVQHPELVRGLVLISTGARLPVNLALIEELSTPQGALAAVDRILGWSFNPGTPKPLIEGVRKAMLETRPSVLAGDFLACDAVDLRSELAGISLPTLVLVGENDKMTPLKYSEELAVEISGAELQVIRGAGHMLPLEAPERVEEALRMFLESCGE